MDTLKVNKLGVNNGINVARWRINVTFSLLSQVNRK